MFRTHVAVVVALCLAACQGASPAGDTGPGTDAKDTLEVPVPPADRYLAAGPHAAGTTELDLIDTTRPTPPHASDPGAPERRLHTVVWYPATAAGGGDPFAEQPDAPAAATGPWPLVVYCHGFMSSSRENAGIAAALATRGFVVAAIDFPLTRMTAPGGATVEDAVNEPADVRFVIEQLVAASADPSHRLHGMIDQDRIGLAGVSLGGLVTLVTALHPSLRDPRIRAAAAAAAPGCEVGRVGLDEVRLPVLLVHGTRDEVIYYQENAKAAFDAVAGPKWLVTIDGGTHAGMAGLGTELLTLAGNTDEVSCTALGANGTVTADAMVRMATAFGADPAAVAACPIPCSRPVTTTPGIDPGRQVRLLRLALVAFMEAFVAGDDGEGAAFLDRGLSAEGPVTVLAGP